MNNNNTNMNGLNQGGSFSSNGLGNDVTSPNMSSGMNSLNGMSLGNVETSAGAPNSFGNPNMNAVPPVSSEMQQSAPVSGGVTFSVPTVEPVPQNSSAPTMDMNLNGTNPQNLDTSITSNGPSVGTTSVPNNNMNVSPMMNDMNFNENSMNGSMMNPQVGVSSLNMNADANMAQNNFVNNSMSSAPNLDASTFGQTSNGGINNNIMGSVPTPPMMTNFDNNPKPGKKGLSKPLVIVLVILLIAIVGIGVYVVLNQTNLSKPKGSILINDPITLPLGKELSTNVSDYATVSGFDSMVCSLDLSKVDTKKMGSYDFTVSCGTTSKSGKIVLQDKEAPVVTTKEVVIAPGATVTLEDFIVSCTDDSNCSYELSDSSQSLKDMASSVGVYEFDLIVSDDYNNSTTVQLTLNVTNNAPVKYMYCTQTATDADNMDASLETSYRYGINDEDGLSQTQKILNYIFQTTNDYIEAKEKFDTNFGEVTFNDEDLIISVTIDMTVDELSQEFNVSPFPTNYDDLKEFNLNQGISCKNR